MKRTKYIYWGLLSIIKMKAKIIVTNAEPQKTQPACLGVTHARLR